MTLEEFRESVAEPVPPAGLSAPLFGLWLAAKGDWDGAHDAVSEVETREAAWVHAHLHRIEGDLDNAAYWYGVAGRPVSAEALEAEHEAIAEALLTA